MFSFLRRIHWCVALCAVNKLAPWCDTLPDGPPSVDSTSFSRRRSIAGYRPTIVLIAAGRRRVHSVRWSKILGQNPDFCLSHVHSTPPLGFFPSEYCYNVWYGKIKTVWLPEGENFFEDVLLRFDRMYERDRHTDRHTDIHRMTAKAAPA